MRRGQNLPALTPIDANNVGTPEELFAFLNQLSAIDDGPMGSLMSAHIEALQFVQSPQAINSAIARTLDHVVRAMDAAGTL